MHFANIYLHISVNIIRKNLGRFTNDEIRDIAGKIGCTYYNYFEMEDGTQI